MPDETPDRRPDDRVDDLVARLDALSEGLASPDEAVRRAAGEALVTLGDPRAEGYLRKLARAKDPVARHWGKRALHALTRGIRETREAERQVKVAGERRALAAHLSAWWGANRRALAAAALAAGLLLLGRASFSAYRRAEARAPLAAAEAHFIAGRAGEARSALEAYLAEHPSDPDALARLADLAFSSGDAAEARRRVEELEAAAPGSFHYRRMAGKHLSAKPGDAARFYRDLLATGSDPQAMLEAARAFHAAGDTAEAALTLERLLAKHPGFLAARLAAADFAAARGDVEAALANAERALEAAPGHPDALARVGLARFDRGDFPGAAAAFEAALARRPADADLAFNLGLAEERAGRDDAAAAAYGIALSLDPGHTPARLNLAVLHGRRGRPALEYAEYRTLAERDPANALAPFNAGIHALQSGNTERAGRLFERAAALAPRHGPSHVNAGLLAEGRSRALATDPAAAAVFRRQALEHYRAARAADPDDPVPAERLAALGEPVR